jgi:hypothetical protein
MMRGKVIEALKLNTQHVPLRQMTGGKRKGLEEVCIDDVNVPFYGYKSSSNKNGKV